MDTLNIDDPLKEKHEHQAHGEDLQPVVPAFPVVNVYIIRRICSIFDDWNDRYIGMLCILTFFYGWSSVTWLRRSGR